MIFRGFRIVKPSLGKVRVGAGNYVYDYLMVCFWFRVFPFFTRFWLRFQYGYAGKHGSESSSAASPKTISKT